LVCHLSNSSNKWPILHLLVLPGTHKPYSPDSIFHQPTPHRVPLPLPEQIGSQW
jgi:hypothetical protein